LIFKSSLKKDPKSNIFELIKKKKLISYEVNKIHQF